MAGIGRLALGALAGMAAAAGGAVAAQAPGFTALAGLERGQWELRESGGETRMICVSDPATLFQQRHRGAQCSRVVVENSAAVATVHYSCPGSGQGRTTITVSTPRAIRIESSGIDGGSPFDIELEGRHVGRCLARR